MDHNLIICIFSNSSQGLHDLLWLKRIRWGATLRSMLPRGKSHGQPYWPLEHLTSRQKSSEKIKQRKNHGKNMTKTVGCEILMLENPHRCNRRPFLSSNLRNEGRSSTRVISLYQLKESDRCLMCQPAMEEPMGTAFAKAWRIDADGLDTSSCRLAC